MLNRRMSRGRVLWTLLLSLAALTLTAAPALAASVSNAADDLRTGWYANQPGLGPSNVSASNFGQLFSASVNGQVYAQPLVASNTLFVATETNDIYGLDPATGAQRWTRNVGTPFDAADIPGGCADLTPKIGVTGTPAIDTATGTAYFFAKTYATGGSTAGAWEAHAVDVTNGNERPGFPVRIQGPAQNNSSTFFNPTTELQRPGLLLMNGVVYAAFGSHCDQPPWQGWVVGVSSAGQVTSMWTAIGSGANENGAGIWQSGGGLMSDGPGQIVLASGNPGSPKPPQAGQNPAATADLGESVVRLAVQPDGTLRSTDFFAPYDAANLDLWDADFGSGGPMGLPSSFGTARYPRLMVTGGKEGYVYLLDRDNLGGIAQGPNGSDAVLDRQGPYGPVYSRASVWPGDGGYVYLPNVGDGIGACAMCVYRVGADASGNPRLSEVAKAGDASGFGWGFGSGAPVVTSNATASGSAVMWAVWSPNGSGAGAQLRAYNAVPSAGTLPLLKSFPVGTATKFAPPGVAGNRVYVGARDGRVLGFGAPIVQSLSAPSVAFPTTTVGSSSTRNAVITSSQNGVVVNSITSSTGQFTRGAPSSPLPATLNRGQTLTVPVTFAPTSSGLKGAQLDVSSSAGPLAVGLSGTGQANGPELTASPPALSFGGTAVGHQVSGSVVFSNTGSQPLTVSAQALPPSPPFSVSGLPAPGSTIASGQSVTATVTFAPSAAGSFTGAVGLVTNAGTKNVGVSGSAQPPAQLSVTPTDLDYGPLVVGQRATRSFVVSNTGGSRLVITRSKPPAGGDFTATSTLYEGTTLNAGQAVTETVRYTPSSLGAASGTWDLNADDGGSARPVRLTGTGLSGQGPVPDPAAGGWDLNGTSVLTGGGLQLTGTGVNEAGSAFWPTPQDASYLRVAFDANIDSGTGADGLALVLADPGRGAAPDMLGAPGGGLGFSGIPGLAVALDTYQNQVNPSSNFVGVADGFVGGQPNLLNWLATTSDVPALRGATRHVVVTVAGGTLDVAVDGRTVLSRPVSLPPKVLLGFSAAQGELTDRHAVSRVVVTNAPPPSPSPPSPSPPPSPGSSAPKPRPSLAIAVRVVAPRRSRQRRQRFAYRGRCPSAFAVRALASGRTATPRLPGARQGGACSVAQSVVSGRGWSTSLSINGGRRRRLRARRGRLSAPAFRLATGRNTLIFTNRYVAPRRR